MFGLRVDEVSEALDLREVELARVEGAPRELPRLRETEVLQRSERAHHGVDDSDAAVYLHQDDVRKEGYNATFLMTITQIAACA